MDKPHPSYLKKDDYFIFGLDFISLYPNDMLRGVPIPMDPSILTPENKK